MPLQPTLLDERLADLDRQLASAVGDVLPQQFDMRDLYYAERRTEQLKAAEQQRTIQELLVRAAKGGVGALGYLAGTIDKPFAAARGLTGAVGSAIRGDLEGVKEGFEQSLLLLPFSESHFMGNVYGEMFKNLGLPLKIPKEHYSGRQILEDWGAPENRRGFHPIKDPGDAILDTIGFALELAVVPPWLPAVGPLTKLGRAKYGLAGAGTAKIAKSKEAVRGLAGALGENPQLIGSMSPRAGLDENLSRLARAAKLGDDDLAWLSTTIREAPESIRARLDQGVASALSGKPMDLTAALTGLPERVQIASAMQRIDTGVNPAASNRGRIEEMRQGLRAGFALQPSSYWQTLGVPQIQIPGLSGERVARAADTILSSVPARVVRGMFDWTARGRVAMNAQRATEEMTEALRQLGNSVEDSVGWIRGSLMGLSGQFAKLQQFSRLAGDTIGERQFADMLQSVMEFNYKTTRSVDDRVVKLTNSLMNTKAAEAAGQLPSVNAFTRDLYSVGYEVLGDMSRTLFRKLQEIGVPAQTLLDLTGAAHIPRQSPFRRAIENMLERGKPLDTSAGMKASSVSRLRATRQYLLKNAPGGATTLRQWAHDFNVGRPAQTAQYQGPLVAEQAGKYWYGINDYVRVGETMGRIVGFADDASSAKVRWGGGAEELVPIEKIVPSTGPAEATRIIQGVRLSGLQQEAFYRKYLSDFGVPVDSVKGKRALDELRARYGVHRYARPHMDELDDVAAVAFDAKSRINPATGKPYTVKEFSAMLDEWRPPEAADWTPEDIQKWKLPSRFKKDAIKWFKRGGSSRGLAKVLMPKSGRLLFDGDQLNATYRYMRSMGDLFGAMTGFHAGLRKAMYLPKQQKEPAGMLRFVMKKEAEGIPLRQFIEQAQFPLGAKRKRGPSWKPLNTSALDHAVSGFAQEQGMTLEQLEAAAKAAGAASAADYIRIPEQAARELQTVLKILVPRTEESNFFREFVQNVQSSFAAWYTYPRIAFHGRNAMTGAFQALTMDIGIPQHSLTEQLRRATGEVFQAARKGNIDSLDYADEIKQFGIHAGSPRAYDVGLYTQPTSEKLPEGWLPWIAKGLKGNREDWSLKRLLEGVPGIAEKRGVPLHPIMEAGRRAYAFTETLNRVPTYLVARRNGMSPSQAKELVSRVHYDYSRISPFERDYVRPGFMFYGWIRSNLGYILPRLTLDWSTKQARVLQGIGRAWAQRREEMPEWLEDSMAIPVPIPGTNGKTRVVRQFGLPLEDIGKFGRTKSDAVLSLLASTHPMISGAYRIITGEDPFFNRKITGADSITSWGGKARLPEGTSRNLALIESLLPWTSPLRYLKRFFDHEQTGKDYLFRTLDMVSGIKTDEYDLAAQKLSDAITFQRRLLDENARIRWGSFPYVPRQFQPETLQEQMALSQFRTAQQYRQSVFAGERPVPRLPMAE